MHACARVCVAGIVEVYGIRRTAHDVPRIETIPMRYRFADLRSHARYPRIGYRAHTFRPVGIYRRSQCHHKRYPTQKKVHGRSKPVPRAAENGIGVQTPQGAIIIQRRPLREVGGFNMQYGTKPRERRRRHRRPVSSTTTTISAQ